MTRTTTKSLLKKQAFIGLYNSVPAMLACWICQNNQILLRFWSMITYNRVGS